MNITELSNHLPEKFSETELLMVALKIAGPGITQNISTYKAERIVYIFEKVLECIILKRECDDLFAKLDASISLRTENVNSGAKWASFPER